MYVRFLRKYHIVSMLYINKGNEKFADAHMTWPCEKFDEVLQILLSIDMPTTEKPPKMISNTPTYSWALKFQVQQACIITYTQVDIIPM